MRSMCAISFLLLSSSTSVETNSSSSFNKLRVSNSGARKTLEHFEPIALQSCVLANPKRRIDRERINVREKIARLIHHVNRRFAIGNTNVHVQSENKIRARELLHVLDDFLVALAL